MALNACQMTTFRLEAYHVIYAYRVRIFVADKFIAGHLKGRYCARLNLFRFIKVNDFFPVSAPRFFQIVEKTNYLCCENCQQNGNGREERLKHSRGD